MGFVVHTSAFNAHRSAIPGKLWFLGNFNSNIGHFNMPVGGGVICRPVIAERGLSGASHLMGLTVEGWYSQITCTAMQGKLWFPRPIGRLFRENSVFSKILTRTLGTITCAGKGWGNLQACHHRARTFGS